MWIIRPYGAKGNVNWLGLIFMPAVKYYGIDLYHLDRPTDAGHPIVARPAGRGAPTQSAVVALFLRQGEGLRSCALFWSCLSRGRAFGCDYCHLMSDRILLE